MQTYQYKFKLNPANRKAVVDFKAQEELLFRAAENCNLGVNFKREKKAIMLEQIKSNTIYLTLSSATELSSPTRTLAAYSRELIRLNKETSVLDELIYNHTLFRTELIETIKDPEISIDTVSDTDLLKAIIDLLYSSADSYNTNFKNETVSKLKEIMLPYIK